MNEMVFCSCKIFQLQAELPKQLFKESGTNQQNYTKLFVFTFSVVIGIMRVCGKLWVLLYFVD